MTLNILKNRYRIKLADDDFFKLLLNNSKKIGEHRVRYQFFEGNIQTYYENSNVYVINNSNLWFSHTQKSNRSLFAFGADTPEFNDKPICLIDFPIDGINTNCMGAYADDKGMVSILIRISYQKLRKIPADNVLTSPERVQATEKSKKRYFITLGTLNQVNIINNIINFVQEMGEITNNTSEIVMGLEDSKPDKKLTSEEDTCILCGKPLSNSQLDLMDEVKSLGQKDHDKCYDCMGKIYAARALSEIQKQVSIKLFNEKTLIKSSNEPDTFRLYFKILKKLSLIKNFSKDVYIFNQTKNIDDFIKTYSGFIETPITDQKRKDVTSASEEIDTTSTLKEINGKKVCDICSVKLDLDNFYKSKDAPDGLSDKCKVCSRKAHAAKAIEETRKFVDPDTPFNKEDLLKESGNRMVFLDYFWTLQEFDLLDEDKKPDFYLLKGEKELNKFVTKYGEKSEPFISKPSPEETEKKTTPKLAKICQICRETLPISNFYKSPSSEDGYSDKCKECSRKSYAARALNALLECVEPGVFFYKKDLLDQCENQLQFRDYFWTLQELDLLEYNEKTDLYNLQKEEIVTQFLNKYGETPQKEKIEDIIDEKPVEDKTPIEIPIENPFEEEKTQKDLKICVSCGKSLPISNFYKSSYNVDGLVDSCKTCADNNNAAKILKEMENHVDIGVPFTKKELIEKLDNETKANYYIWTLQEQDVISYTERTNTYILEDNEKFRIYKDIIKTEKETKKEPPKTIKVEKTDVKNSHKGLDCKEIIYISNNDGSVTSNLIIKGIIENVSLIDTLNSLKGLIESNTNKIFVNQHLNNYFELIVDLNLKKESVDEALILLRDQNWVDITNNRD